jgi:cytochrome c oxidase subunit 1
MVFNYKMVVYGGVGGIVLLSGEVWVHHLYVSGMADWLRIGQMVTTLMISIPVGLMMIGLIGTLYKGSIAFTTPMLYALGVVFLFLIGGLTGIPLAVPSLTIGVSDTYYVVGHFHYVMAVAGTFAIFGGVYHWFPKMTGRMYNEFWGKVGFWITFVGVNIVFWIMMDGRRQGHAASLLRLCAFPAVRGAHQWMTGRCGDSCRWLRDRGAELDLGAMKGAPAGDNPWGSQVAGMVHRFAAAPWQLAFAAQR